MAESDRPQSPSVGMADFSARTPVRVLSPDEIERMLAEHRLYLETEYHQGHRANFSSADLTGRDFSGPNRRDLTGGVLRPCGSIPGASKWGEPRFGQSRERLPRQGRYGVRPDGQRS